jgi:hypothetical protein
LLSAPQSSDWVRIEVKAIGSSLVANIERPPGNFIGTLSATDTTFSSGYVGIAAGEWDADRNPSFDALCVGKIASPEPTTSVGAEDILITQAGSPTSWSWKVPSQGEKIRSGSAINWSWVPFQIVSSWQYRKPVTVSNSGSALTDYQVLVTLDTASLISAGKMRSDCGDIRFTDSDGSTLLNYWIESGCNSASTKIWVKVPSIPGSSTKTIYVYYGNSSATSQSNGDTTFAFFDDFPGTTLNTSKWQVNASGADSDGSYSYSVSNGKLIISATSPSGTTGGAWIRLRSLNPINLDNFALYANASSFSHDDNRGSFGQGEYGAHRIGLFDINSLRWGAAIGAYGDYYDTYFYEAASVCFGGCAGDNGNPPNSGNIIVNYTKIGNTMYMTLGGSFSYSVSNSSAPSPFNPFYVFIAESARYWTDQTSTITYWDYIYVRKYTSPEPTTSVGVEEIFSSAPLGITVPRGSATSWQWGP